MSEEGNIWDNIKDGNVGALAEQLAPKLSPAEIELAQKIERIKQLEAEVAYFKRQNKELLKDANAYKGLSKALAALGADSMDAMLF